MSQSVITVMTTRSMRLGNMFHLASGSVFFLSLAKYPSANATFNFSCAAGEESASDSISVNFSDDLLPPVTENLSNSYKSAQNTFKPRVQSG